MDIYIINLYIFIISRAGVELCLSTIGKCILIFLRQNAEENRFETRL